MRKLMYLCYAIVFAGVLFFLSCQKENQTSEIQTAIPKSILTASSREGNPFTDARVRVENGMLVFDSYIAFKEIQKELREMAENAELNRNLLLETGFNPDTDEDEELEQIPLNPVYKAFAEHFGIETEQQKEEKEFKEYLKTPNNPEDFPDGCSYDPSFKALLNNQREVGVGNFIVKCFSMEKTALIYNRNTAVLERVRNTPIEQLKNGFDLKILDENNAIIGANEIFSGESEEDRVLTGGMCTVSFDSKSVNGNTFEFTNTSMVDLSDCGSGSKFQWDFGDGVFLNNGAADGPVQKTYTSDKYPYTVTLRVLCGPCAGKVFTKKIEKSNSPCDISNMDVKATVLGNEIEITVLGAINTDVVTVDFGFPGSTPEAVTSLDFSIKHLYIQHIITYPITVSVTRPGCPNPIIINLSVTTGGCGHKNGKTVDRTKGYDADSRYWQLSGAIWSRDNSFVGVEAGSSSQAYRYGKNEVFKVAKNVPFIYTDAQGELIREIGGHCMPTAVSLVDESLQNDSYVKTPNLMLLADRVRFEDFKFFSKHKMTLPDGINKLEISKLFLVN